MSPRRLVGPLLATAVISSVMVGLALTGAAEPLSREGGIFRYRRAQWLYRYDPTFRKEALFDAVSDDRETRDLARERPEVVEDLRAAFLRHVKFRRLSELPATDDAWRKALEGVGYVGGSGDDR